MPIGGGSNCRCGGNCPCGNQARYPGVAYYGGWNTSVSYGPTDELKAEIEALRETIVELREENAEMRWRLEGLEK
jgi:hypothetical protein